MKRILILFVFVTAALDICDANHLPPQGSTLSILYSLHDGLRKASSPGFVTA
jgi:hypothetical protein